nr:hypothetical protein Iba_chr07eCG10280 [Ipomoea batatas]
MKEQYGECKHRQPKCSELEAQEGLTSLGPWLNKSEQFSTPQPSARRIGERYETEDRNKRHRLSAFQHRESQAFCVPAREIGEQNILRGYVKIYARQGQIALVRRECEVCVIRLNALRSALSDSIAHTHEQILVSYFQLVRNQVAELITEDNEEPKEK